MRVHERDFDACVIAVPATIEIAFDPPLPEWKRRAIAAVRYGDAAKLFQPLAEPAEPSATLSVPNRFWAYTQRAPDGSPLPVLAAFAGTRAGVDRLTPSAVRDLRPDLAYTNAEPVLSTWHDDPWMRGAYSARSVESPLDDRGAGRAGRAARLRRRAHRGRVARPDGGSAPERAPCGAAGPQPSRFLR